MNRHILILTQMLLVFSQCSVDREQPFADGDGTSIITEVPSDAVPGRVRVKLSSEPLQGSAAAEAFPYLSGLGDYTIARTFPDAGVFEQRHREEGLHLWYDIIFDKDVPLTRAGDVAGKIDGVECVEYVYDAKPTNAFTFNDPLFSKQWHYYNEGDTGESRKGKVAGCDINLLPAWKVTTGRPDVIVAVNDYSAKYDHEDLMSNMWVNEAELNGLPGVDDDNNGYEDDIYGYNFMTYNGTNPYGKLIPGDHGTHIAGVIAAVNNNGIGVCGIAGGDGSSGTGVRIINTQASGGSAFIGASIVYAADMGAVLMNCSWSIGGYSKSISDAIDYFNKYAGIDKDGNQTGPMAGGLAIFAAGNDATDSCYPAQQDNVFSVAAIGADFIRSYYTNYGTWVDISAPGGDANKGFQIYSTVIKGGESYNSDYGMMQGTSMACPHVTGVAALVVSRFGGPGFTRDRLISILKRTANKRMFEYNTGYETRLGAGMVDAGSAVTYGNATPAKVTDLRGKAVANRITLEWSVPGKSGDEPPFCYYLYYAKNSLATLDSSSLPSDVVEVRIQADDSSMGATMSYTLDNLDFSWDYHFRVSSESVLGSMSSLSDELVVSTVYNSKPRIEARNGTEWTLRSHEKATFGFILSDEDGQPLTYSVTGDLKGLGHSRTGDVVTMTVDALRADEGGTYSGEISVTDSYDTFTLPFSYVVLENHSPEVDRQIENVVLNGRNQFLEIRLGDYFKDADGELLSYEVGISTTSIVVKYEINDGVLRISGNSFGTAKMSVTATDARGKYASQEFSILVRDGSKLVDIYPNPVKDKLNVRVGEESNGLKVRIVSSSGAEVYNDSFESVTPFNPLSIDLSKVDAGQYTVVVNCDGKEYKSFITKI